MLAVRGHVPRDQRLRANAWSRLVSIHEPIVRSYIDGRGLERLAGVRVLSACVAHRSTYFGAAALIRFAKSRTTGGLCQETCATYLRNTGSVVRVKRYAVTIAGFGVLAIGAVLLVLPGPGLLLIVVGFAILATEYVWAHRLMVRAKKEARRVQEAAVASRLRTGGSLAFASGLVGLGFTLVIVDDLAWPFFRAFFDKLWGPVTGGVLMLTGSILMTTTIITRMTAKGRPTTHLGDPVHHP